MRLGIRPSAQFFERFVGRPEPEIWDELIGAYGITTPPLLFENVADYLRLGSPRGAVVIAVSHGFNRSTALRGDAIVASARAGTKTGI